jgi:hypothetical protein
LYFTAGYFDEAHGLFGSITVAHGVLSRTPNPHRK